MIINYIISRSNDSSRVVSAGDQENDAQQDVDAKTSHVQLHRQHPGKQHTQVSQAACFLDVRNQACYYPPPMK